MNDNGFFQTPAKPPAIIAGATPLTIQNWSFSSLSKYEECPLQTKFARIDKLPRPPSDPDSPGNRGSAIHAEIEAFITKGEEIQTELKNGSELIEHCREEFLADRAFAEKKFAFDLDWNLVEPNTPDMWVQMILDVLILDSSTEATIIDWKTGKSWMKDVSHMQQAQLYVAGVFRAFPDLETVTTRFVYTNERDKQTIRQFNRTQGEASRVAFHNRGGRMTTETKFAPKPSQRNCKYCDFGSQHGTKHCIYDVNREDAIRPRGGLTGQRRR